MRVLYVAHLSPNDSAEYRRLALEREGHTCLAVDQYRYGLRNTLLRKVEHRLVAGPEVRRFNRDLIALAREHRPAVLWRAGRWASRRSAT